MKTRQIVLANPRGFCAGVDRAIAIVERALAQFGAPIYVRHEVVHNRYVVERLRAQGAVFVEELEEVPAGATVIFSAHGVAKGVRAEADARGLRVFDATCPLVTKVHVEVSRSLAAGRQVVLVGHRGHPEVEGTLGQWLLPAQQQHLHLVEHEADVAALPLTPDASVAYVTQTTLSVDDTRKVVDALRQRFAGISAPRRDDICYATQNRQDAVRALAAQVDGVLVVGSVNSSNSNRLRELAEQCGKPSYLIDSAEDIQAQWLTAWQVVGVTAGASAPEVLVAAVIARLQALLGADTPVTELAGRAETIAFSLPRELAARTA